MLKQKALDHFKTTSAIADALGISVAAVSNWEDVIPEGSAYKLQVVTNGRLRVDPRLYKDRPKRGQAIGEAHGSAD